MKIINIKELKKILNDNKVALLCGNGFSMNFDSRYRNIYSHYFSSHKALIRNHNYKVIGNSAFKKVLKNNFNSVIKYMYSISENEFYKIFDDALEFAKSIKTNERLCELLVSKSIVGNLVFGAGQLVLVNSICDTSASKGIEFVNIEHWTILVYFYYALKDIDSQIYSFPNNNRFLTIIKLGDSYSSLINNQLDYNGKSLINGFLTYYRFLVAQTVLNGGKSITGNELDNIHSINIDSVRDFISYFKVVITTNYDHLIERITSRSVIHLHGKFVKNCTEYVFNQSLSTVVDGIEVSFSDMTIGDYFLLKTFLPVTNNLMKGQNKKIHLLDKQFSNIISDSFVNVLLLFGLNIENDQHILRHYLLELFNRKVQNPQIIYCYFLDGEKNAFNDMFYKVITFRDDVNEYCKKISVIFVNTKDILKEYF